MNKRFVLMILLCSAVCYAPDPNKLDSVYEKKDMCRPCEIGEYFSLFFSLKYSFFWNSSIEKAFLGAAKEGNIKEVRAIVCRSIDSLCCNRGRSIRNDWNNMNQEGLKIAIEEGNFEIAKFLLINCRIRDDESDYDKVPVANDYKISIIDKLIENEHKYKDPVALAKIMKQRGVVPYFSKEKYRNYVFSSSDYEGEFIESKHLKAGSKSEIVQYYLKECGDDIEKKKKEIEEKLKKQAKKDSKKS